MKIISIHLALVLVCLKLFSFQTMLDTCEETSNKFLKYKTYPNTNETWSVFSQFNMFSDLIPTQSSCDVFFNITSFLDFKPSQLCIFDFSFDFKVIFNQRQINSIFTVCINKLKGFDIHTKPLTIPRKIFNKQNYLQIFASYLEFYSNGYRINSHKECNLDIFNNTLNFLNSWTRARI